MNALDTMFFKMADHQAVNQATPVVQTDMFVASIERVMPSALADMQVSVQGASTGARVSLPKSFHLNNNISDVYVSVSRHNVYVLVSHATFIRHQ